MPESSNTGYLQPFIEATAASAARFRRVLIVMIIVSILAFGAFWNAQGRSWINSRIDRAHTAREYLSLKDELKQLELSHSKKTEEQEQRKKEVELRLGSSDMVRAKEWLGLMDLETQDQVDKYAENLWIARLNNVILIKIPFFGVVIDINDLGLLGGFTFVVVLMWFRFSLWREYLNVSSTFQQAKTEDLEFSYTSLAARQVLTVPPTLTESEPNEPLGKVVRILYFLPVVVQLMILAYDLASVRNGWVISRFNTVVGLSLTALFLGISGMLTYRCLQLSNQIDTEWHNTARRIRKQAAGGQPTTEDTGAPPVLQSDAQFSTS